MGHDVMSDETETPRPEDQAEDQGETEGQGDAAQRDAGVDAEADASPDAVAEQTAAGPLDEAPPPADVENDVETLKAELAGLRDKLLRTAAEAENTRKRAEREIADARVYAVTNFASDLLSVDDNLARALGALSPELREGMRSAGRTLLDGIEMTQKTLHAALARHSVQPIAADPGQPFDPNLHEALQQRETDAVEPGQVVEEFQRGYMMGDRLLRAAMVVVATAPKPPAEPAPEEPSDADDPGEAN